MLEEKAFHKLLEEALEVRSDWTGRYFLVRLPGEGWRLYWNALEGARLLAEGEEALRLAARFALGVRSA